MNIMTLQDKYSALVVLVCIWLSFTRPLEGKEDGKPIESCMDWEIQLAGGPNEFEGRVEICLSGKWRQVCGHINDITAKVVCRRVISPTVIPEAQDKSVAFVWQGDSNDNETSFVVENLACNGAESKLDECFSSSTVTTKPDGCNNGYAAVLCQGMYYSCGLPVYVDCTHDNPVLDPVCFCHPESVRLTEKGRVEVCHHLHQYRIGVCDNNWDDIDASVTCNELNPHSKNLVSYSTSGHLAKYFASAFVNVSCNGNELKLSHCNRNQTTDPYPNQNCSFAGVNCNDQSNVTDLPLATGPSPDDASQPSLCIKTTAGPDPHFTSETDSLLETSTQTTSNRSTMLTSTEGAIQGNVPNQATIIGSAFGAFSGLLILLVLIVVILVLVYLIMAGRKQKKSTLAQSVESSGTNGHSSRYADNVSQPIASSENEDAERVLSNPLYTKTSVIPPSHEYATLEESLASNFTKSGAQTESSPYYSTPDSLQASYNSGTKLIVIDSPAPGPDHLYDDAYSPSSPRTLDGTTQTAKNGVSNGALYEQPPLNDNVHETMPTSEPHLYAVLDPENSN